MTTRTQIFRIFLSLCLSNFNFLTKRQNAVSFEKHFEFYYFCLQKSCWGNNLDCFPPILKMAISFWKLVQRRIFRWSTLCTNFKIKNIWTNFTFLTKFDLVCFILANKNFEFCWINIFICIVFFCFKPKNSYTTSTFENIRFNFHIIFDIHPRSYSFLKIWHWSWFTIFIILQGSPNRSQNFLSEIHVFIFCYFVFYSLFRVKKCPTRTD